MKAIAGSALVLCATVYLAASVAAQTPAQVEDGLGLDRAARRQVQEGLQAAGFDPGGVDGIFGPRTRSAIRRWQTSRGARATGYLDGVSLAALRPSMAGQPTSRERELAGVAAASPAAAASPPAVSAAQQQSPPASARVDAPRRPGDVFRDCKECPEMVVLAGGDLAMGRYEVTVEEYRAFASATGAARAAGCNPLLHANSWQNPGYPQTDRHPVTCVSWYDAQAYVSWLSQLTGAAYRLPTEAEWERAAAGSRPGCDVLGRGPSPRRRFAHQDPRGACPVGSYGTNAAGLSDMVGNVSEWTSNCSEGNERCKRGGNWSAHVTYIRRGANARSSDNPPADRYNVQGLRVSRSLDPAANSSTAEPAATTTASDTSSPRDRPHLIPSEERRRQPVPGNGRWPMLHRERGG